MASACACVLLRRGHGLAAELCESSPRPQSHNRLRQKRLWPADRSRGISHSAASQPRRKAASAYRPWLRRKVSCRVRRSLGRCRGGGRAPRFPAEARRAAKRGRDSARNILQARLEASVASPVPDSSSGAGHGIARTGPLRSPRPDISHSDMTMRLPQAEFNSL